MTARKTEKLLLIFDLNGTLGYLNKNPKTFNKTGIYQDGQLQAKPAFEDQQTQIYQRPNLSYVNYDLLVKEKKQLDIGIWSSQNRENTELLVKHLFGKFFTQLLFVSFTAKRDWLGREVANNDLELKAQPLARNLSSIYAKFPHYDETNTIMISNFHNKQEEYQRNDLILPEYHPKMGGTDFLDDKHMFYLYKYIRFLYAMEKVVGEDIRHRMEFHRYEFFIQKLTKSVRYDSYQHSTSSTPEF